jgi:hypothetical protein
VIDSTKPCKKNKLLSLTSPNPQKHYTTHVFRTVAENKFCVLTHRRLFEFELSLQLSYPTFLFELSFCKIRLYEAMCQNTEAFRHHFATVLEKFPRPIKGAESAAFYKKVIPFCTNMARKLVMGNENPHPHISVYIDDILDEELWRCFQEDRTPESLLTSWLHEVHISLILLLGTRLTWQAKKQVLRTIKKLWQKLLIKTLASVPQRMISMANLLQELADKDPERKLMNLIPFLYSKLVKEVHRDCHEATEQLMNILDNVNRVLKKVYSKDILEGVLISIEKKQKAIPAVPKCPESKRKYQSAFCKGLGEYYLGRLNEAIFYWTKDIEGKKIYLN